MIWTQWVFFFAFLYIYIMWYVLLQSLIYFPSVMFVCQNTEILCLENANPLLLFSSIIDIQLFNCILQ